MIVNTALYIVPCTNPFGFQGYNRCLSYVLGRAVSVSSNKEACALLKAESAPIFENEEFALFVIRASAWSR